MARTIKRGAKGVRRSAAASTARRKVERAKAGTGNAAGQVLRFLPFTQEQVQRFFLVLILAGAAALAWFIASLAGFPALAQRQIASMAAEAGFEVRRVEVRGVERMNELKVYERVLGQQARAMPLVDLAALREELLELSWVQDARVSRQLPDTLVVDIVERRPHAVLRKPGRLVLVDLDGQELEPVTPANAQGMLVVEGPGAASQVRALARLLDSAPALRPQVSEAEWIGNRRWNITFSTGQVLALPAGDEAASSALVTFAQLDGVNRLLGGQVVAFDMRRPERIYMRIPGRSQMELATGEAN